MTPEDDVMQAVQYLTAALKGNLHIAMDESRIDQIKKLYAMFDTTAKNFQQRKEKQHPKLGKNTWISARRVREEPATSTRVSEEPLPTPKYNTNQTTIEKGAKQKEAKCVKVTTI